jgi:hypothetical protein
MDRTERGGHLSDEGEALLFVHRFSRKLQCEIRVKDQAPIGGENLSLKYEWTGRPSPRDVNEYRQWVLSVAQSLCDRWNTTMLYCLGSSKNCTELWCFEPGKPPKLMDKIPAGL